MPTIDLNDADNAGWLERVHSERLLAFENEIRRLTQPVGDPPQYPRPWHISTKVRDPLNATVFVVGYNQATKFLANPDLPHDPFIAGLFNRGPTCEELYEKARGGKPKSRARHNIEKLVEALAAEGIHQVFETNVVCYSTGNAEELRRPEHREGRERGEALFRFLLTEIKPRVLVVHGKKAAKELDTVLKTVEHQPHVETIGSLAPPQADKNPVDYAAVARKVTRSLVRPPRTAP